MNSVVLAGGLGSRLFPLTKITGKHLLPVYNEPMVYYPTCKLVPSGRGELEITGLNNNDLEEAHLAYSVLDGWWTDAGTFASLRLATSRVAESVQRKGEEVATNEGTGPLG